jgi:hypothetical protein
MTIEELVEAAKKMVATEESVKAFEQRVMQHEEQFEIQSRNRLVDSEFLARSYNL